MIKHYKEFLMLYNSKCNDKNEVYCRFMVLLIFNFAVNQQVNVTIKLNSGE